jgi:hypothetical protein
MEIKPMWMRQLMTTMMGLLVCVGAADAGNEESRNIAAELPAVDSASVIAKLEASVPVPREADVRSIKAIMGAIYDSISGPAGPHDWDRFRSLMLPKARLTEATVDEKGQAQLRQWGVEEFIAEAGPSWSVSPSLNAP